MTGPGARPRRSSRSRYCGFRSVTGFVSAAAFCSAAFLSAAAFFASAFVGFLALGLASPDFVCDAPVTVEDFESPSFASVDYFGSGFTVDFFPAAVLAAFFARSYTTFHIG